MKRTIDLLSITLLAVYILGGCSAFMDDFHTIEEPGAAIAVDKSSLYSIYNSVSTAEEVAPFLKDGLGLGAVGGNADVVDGIVNWDSMTFTFYKRHNPGKDGGLISYATFNIDIKNMRIERIEQFKGNAKSADSPVFAPMESPVIQIQAFDAMVGELIEGLSDTTFGFNMTNIGDQDGLYITIGQEKSRLIWEDGIWQA